MAFSYDDTNLQRLFNQLDLKNQVKALKGVFRREANTVRKVAVSNLRGSDLHTTDDMEKGIRALVFKRKAGFRVTIGTKKANRQGKGERGMHLNRRGLKKPVLIWAEGGTKARYTKSKTRFFVRSRKGHYTGEMPSYPFMSKTRTQVADWVTEDMHNEIAANVMRTAKRYGCK